MYAAQLEAYQAVQKTTMSGRDLEAVVLAKAAHKLQQCQGSWDAPDRDALLAEALRYNQTVWSFFQSELVKPDNPLPKKLREDIVSLSIFIDKRILDIMVFPEPGKLDIIIDINLNIAAGLRGSPTP